LRLPGNIDGYWCCAGSVADNNTVCEKSQDIWEVRIHLEGRIARVLFTVSDGKIVLLHGFIKKSKATPKPDLKLAKDRMRGE